MQQALRIDIPTLPEFKALTEVHRDTGVSLCMPTSPHPDGAHANRCQGGVGAIDRGKIEKRHVESLIADILFRVL
jgi:hypothetical protein